MYFSTPNFVFAKFAHFIIMNRLSATIAATSIKQSKVSKKKVTLKHYGVKLKAVKKKKVKSHYRQIHAKQSANNFITQISQKVNLTPDAIFLIFSVKGIADYLIYLSHIQLVYTKSANNSECCDTVDSK